MKTVGRRAFFTGLAALPAMMVRAARADKKKKKSSRATHDDALRAREEGSILPLSKVLHKIEPAIDGQLIEIEFEYDHDRPVYEFKYVDPNARVRELHVDARTGKILKDEPD